MTVELKKKKLFTSVVFIVNEMHVFICIDGEWLMFA